MKIRIRTNQVMTALITGGLASKFLSDMLPSCINVPAKDPNKTTCYKVSQDSTCGKKIL